MSSTPLSQSAGQNSARAMSASSARSATRSSATQTARTRGATTSYARGHGTSKTEGESEQWVSVYENLPTQMYSVEEQLTRLTGEIMGLQPRECFIKLPYRKPIRTRTKDLEPAYRSLAFRDQMLPRFLAAATARPISRPTPRLMQRSRRELSTSLPHHQCRTSTRLRRSPIGPLTSMRESWPIGSCATTRQQRPICASSTAGVGISRDMTTNSTSYHKGMLITATHPFKSRKRRSEFARLDVPENVVPPAFRVTPRILAFLDALATHRYLSTDQLVLIDGSGSAAYVRQLLRLLHRHGLVERPRGQEAYLSSFLHNGNYSLAHAITRRGMRILSEHGIAIDPRLDWTTKHTGMSPMFLAHALEVSQFMLDCRLALPADGPLTLTDHNDLLCEFPDPTRARKFPYQLVAHAQIDKLPQTLTVTPDRLFRLVAPQRHWNFALEIDRGTESIATRSRKITRKPTWHKKVLTYFSAYRAGKFLETWGFPALRIVTVTTSDTRIDHMLALQSAVTNAFAPGLFLYTTRERIERHGVLGPAWRSATADNISLVNA